MTPLAHSFAKDLTRPIAQRQVNDTANIIPSFDRMHSFDCEPISEAIEQALEDEDGHAGETIRYLLDDVVMPAEVTWLEFGRVTLRSEGTGDSVITRLAVVVEKQGPWFKIDLAMHHTADAAPTLRVGKQTEPFTISMGRVRAVPLIAGGFEYEETPEMKGAWTDGIQVRSAANRFIAMAMLALDIIGQPSLVRLVTHAPHRGLERQLLRQGVGKYPLLAWHEVVIKPQDRPLTDEEAEGHLTGRKCLHFVRGHRRRYRDGRETTVTHHWRGDPALGMQRTRYRVEPPRKARA
jgi:hypothetical protein